MRYYISDLHFFHENLNHSLDCRGFASAHEMNEYIIEKCRESVDEVQTGEFGSDMKVQLLNDGPFTILLDSDQL